LEDRRVLTLLACFLIGAMVIGMVSVKETTQPKTISRASQSETISRAAQAIAKPISFAVNEAISVTTTRGIVKAVEKPVNQVFGVEK